MAESHTAHHPALQHHFENMEQQREAGTLGMWVFLITEIMFFGVLFMAYTLYRSMNAEGFAAASHQLDVKLGAINTVVLIASSFTMVMAVYGSQLGHRKLLLICLILTMLFGLTFLGIKGVEYHTKFEHHLFPGAGFEWQSPEHDPRLAQPARMFFWIYFAMTGLHALHMVIGLGLMSVIFYYAWRGRYSPEYHAPVEVSGLYWHFVDIVWIFLFPLLYLVGSHLH